MSTNYDLASIGFALDTSYNYLLSGVSITNNEFLVIKNRNDLGIYGNSVIWPLKENQNLSAIGGLSSTPPISFLRSSSATRVNSKGLIEVVGNNIPRFDFDPITLQCKGLLIEDTRSNYLRNSNNITLSPWAYTNVTRTANSTVSPDGTNNANLVTRSDTGNSYIWQDTNVLAANSRFIFSAWLKLGSYSLSSNNNFSIVLKDSNGNVPTNGWTYVSITSAWQRFYTSATFSTTAVGNVACFIDPNDDLTQGQIGDSWYMYGAQLELNNNTGNNYFENNELLPTSYIPTTTLSATRLNDLAYISSANFSNFYNKNNGTWIAEFVKTIIPYSQPGNYHHSGLIGSFETPFNPYVYPLSPLFITGDDTITCDNNIGSTKTNNKVVYSLSAINRAGITYNNNILSPLSGISLCLNNGAIASSTSITNVTGSVVFGGNGSYQNTNLNGYLRQVEYYNITVPTTTLQTLTLTSIA